jgi:AAA15 family ATPase/GTPase
MDFKKISILAEEYNCSVIFNIELMDILFEKTYRVGIHNDKLLFFGDAIRRFYIFATLKLFAITKRRQGFINAAKTEVLPFMMNDSSVIELNLTNSTDMTEGQFVSLKIVVSNQINPVLKNIIPDLTLRVKDLNGDKFDEKMNTIKKIEIIAVKNNVEIPLKYESDGTKKIIGLLCAVIAAANMPDVFLAVDEFDAGVFEFLLGEFLSILQEQMKGRLIFTSHNLIILERLDANSIRFSTVDENKKFVPFVGVKSTHNLRNVYLRNLKLGNDNKNKTDFYNETDKYEISRAIGKAGEEIAYG